MSTDVDFARSSRRHQSHGGFESASPFLMYLVFRENDGIPSFEKLEHPKLPFSRPYRAPESLFARLKVTQCGWYSAIVMSKYYSSRISTSWRGSRRVHHGWHAGQLGIQATVDNCPAASLAADAARDASSLGVSVNSSRSRPSNFVAFDRLLAESLDDLLSVGSGMNDRLDELLATDMDDWFGQRE